MAYFITKKTKNATFNQVKVGDYFLPTADGVNGAAIVIDGSSAHTVFTTLSGAAVQGWGVGVSSELVRWNTSQIIGPTGISYDASGNLSGISTISASGTVILSGLTYPSLDGAAGAYLQTDGSASLSFKSMLSANGLTNRLAVWETASSIGYTDIVATGNNELTNVGDLNIGNNANVSARISNRKNTSLASIDCSIASDVSMCSLCAASTCTITDNAIRSAVIACNDSNVFDQTTNSAIASSMYSTVAHDIRNSAVVACTSCAILTGANECLISSSYSSSITNNCDNAAIGGTTSCSIDSSAQQCTITGASRSSISTCVCCGIAGCTGCAVSDSNNCFVSSCTSCALMSCNQSSIMACTNVTLSGALNTIVLCSDTVSNNGLTGQNASNVVFGGDSGLRTWLISSATGTYYAQNTSITAPVPDFAEFFENAVANQIPYGRFVSLAQNGVKLAAPGERIVGIVSSAPGIVAGGADMHWQGKYQTDEWGNIKYTTVKKMVNGQVFSDQIPLLNPNYNASLPYIPRSQRTHEWTCVGLIGQLRTCVDNTVTPPCYLTVDDSGIGTTSSFKTNAFCMKIINGQQYDPTRGYGIGMVYLKPYI